MQGREGMTEEKKLKKGRFVTKTGESTLESDIEAARVKTLNSFGPRIEKAKERAEKLKVKIQEAREELDGKED